MKRGSALDVSGLAIDWDIKNTPRYCYYLMLDHKKQYLYYRRLKRVSRDDFAKYVSSLSNLWDIARPEFKDDDKKKFDKLYVEPLDFEEVLVLENELMDWYFKQGYFKTGDTYQKFNDIADMIDEQK